MNQSRLNSRIVVTRAAITLVVAGVLAVLDLFGVFEKSENLTRDWRFRLREKLDRDHHFDPRVRVVGITDADLHALGRWPWRRDFHGELTSLLHAAGAETIAFDILFIEPSEDSDADQFFAEAVAEAGGEVALGAEKIGRADMTLADPEGALPNVSGDLSRFQSDEDDSILIPYPALAAAGKVGFVNADADSDGGRRELPLVQFYDGKFYPGLATQTLMIYWGLQPEDVEVRLGDRVIFHSADGAKSVPIDADGKMIVNLRSPPRFLEEGVISYVKLYQALSDHLVEGKDWDADTDIHPAGRIFVVGQVAPGLSDMGPTAFQPLTPLCYLQAQAVSNVLQQDFVKTSPLFWSIPIWCIVTFFVLVFLRNASLRAAFIVPVAVVLLYIGISVGWFSFANVLIPLVWPIVGFGTFQFAAVMRGWQRERDARIATDASLQAAAEIQLSTLPEVSDLGDGPHDFILDAKLIPAQDASGDFYDFFWLDEKRLCLVVADVCDKGITAATFMLQAKTLLKAIASELGKSEYSPETLEEILTRTNNELAEKNLRSMFATVVFGIYEVATGQFDYVTAGHHPPLVRGAQGDVVEKDSTGDLAVGLMAGMPYHQITFTLKVGDSVLLYTDGIPEAFNQKGDMFGSARTTDTFRDAATEDLLGEILSELKSFTGSAEQSDDITALVLTRKAE